MAEVFLRKYGVEGTVPFELYEIDGVDFRTDAASASGDININRDEAVEEQLDADAFVDEGRGYSLVLSIAETTAKRIHVWVVDQTSPKAWLDRDFIVETYGNASAQHPFDLGTATVSVTNLADASAGKLDDILDGTGGTGIKVSTLETTGATTLASLSVTGQLDAGNVLVDGTTVFTGATTFTGAVALDSTLAIAGASTLASLSVTGQLDAGNVLVDGTTVFTGTTTFTGAVALSSTLAIAGASTLASLSVTGQLDAGSVLVDAGMDVVGALSANSLLIDTTTTLTGNVSLGGTLGVTGTTTLTGAVSMPAGLTADITGTIDTATNVGTCTTNTDMVTEPPTAAAIVNEWETQSQADPTGFHVNTMEILSTTADDILYPDKEIDLTTDPAQGQVIYKKAGTATVLETKDLFQPGGAAVTTTDHKIAKEVQE